MGRSFWRTDLESTSAPAEGRGLAAPSARGAGGGRVQGHLLPLKRGRFSASPATGLIGLQENQFLGDFFECLSFLSITNQGTVRDAMVRIMLAGGSTQYPLNQNRRRTPSSFQASPVRCQGIEEDKYVVVGEDCDGARNTTFGDFSTIIDGSHWSNGLVDAREARTLPRDSSTCVLWSAIALGALVRGYPLHQVGRYADLAEDALRACLDPTLDTARACVATAIMCEFLNQPVKTHEYLAIAGSIVDQLPPEHIPRGFHGLLQYAGMSWTLEPELASVEDIKGYWENVPPIWELSENVVEQDICSLVLSTCIRMKQHYVDATGVTRVVFAEEPQRQPQQPRPRAVVENGELQDSKVAVGEYSDSSSAEVEVVEVEQTNVGKVVASTEIPKSVLPEMLRVEEYFESSNVHQGVGGLLYYTGLTYLQALNNEDTSKAFMRSIGVMLRYPGLCRYKSWLWIAHSHLFLLGFGRQRYKYEQVRAAYNSVRPPGSLAVPPFEEFRGVSDICDHPYCRRAAERAEYDLRAKMAQQPAP
eukprot:g6015.t1